MQSPMIVLEYLRNGDLKKFLTVSYDSIRLGTKQAIDAKQAWSHYLHVLLRVK